MIKLYKRSWTGRRDYHEAWMTGTTIVEHWGKLGTRGDSKRHRANPALDEDGNLESILTEARARGFKEIEEDEQRTLLVQYVVDDMGTPQDVEKRHALERHLNELLGWTGLGRCDGGSIGSGTMEACCYVVDFKLARDVIQDALDGTKLGDYSRIFDENG